MSTKCQYQIAPKRPIWRTFLNIPFISRIKQTNKNKVPTITCNPWNPVAIKKVEPYTESAIVKDASKYSIAWKQVK